MKAIFLGAGASRGTFQSIETRIPIAAEFGMVLNSINGSWKQKYPALFKVVNHLKLPIDNWSLESVWSCIDYYAKLEQAIPKRRDWKQESPQLKKALLEVYGTRCDQAADGLPLTDSYTLGRLFKKTLEPGDVLISFNYDTIAERLAYRFGQMLQSVCAQKRKNAIVFAKPHGSTSWTLDLCTGRVTSSATDGAPLRDSLALEDVDACREPLFLGTVPIKSELIREVQTCTPDVFNTITKHWRAVVKAVRDSDRLIIVGYSFPYEDQYGRFLIQEGMRLRGNKRAPTIELYELQEKECERAQAIRDTFGCHLRIAFRGEVASMG